MVPVLFNDIVQGFVALWNLLGLPSVSISHHVMMAWALLIFLKELTASMKPMPIEKKTQVINIMLSVCPLFCGKKA